MRKKMIMMMNVYMGIRRINHMKRFNVRKWSKRISFVLYTYIYICMYIYGDLEEGLQFEKVEHWMSRQDSSWHKVPTRYTKMNWVQRMNNYNIVEQMNVVQSVLRKREKADIAANTREKKFTKQM